MTCPCASPAKRRRARHGLAVLLAIVVTVGLAPHALAQSNTAASTFLTASDPFVREDARRVLIGRAPDSLPTFEAALIDTVNRGGDADTNGAIVGALFGARFGYEAIPEQWETRVLQAMQSSDLAGLRYDYHPQVLLEFADAATRK